MIKQILSPLSYWRALWAGAVQGAGFLFSGQSLEVLRLGWLAMEGALLIIGSLFWATLWMGLPAFAPDVYGTWACERPALAWAAVQIAASALIIYGLMRPMTWRPAFVGAVLHALQYEAIALSALFTGGQVAIAIYPLILFVPAHLVLAVEAWRHGAKP